MSFHSPPNEMVDSVSLVCHGGTGLKRKVPVNGSGWGEVLVEERIPVAQVPAAKWQSTPISLKISYLFI